MLSLRTIARVAPRFASRSIATAARHPFISRQSIKSQIPAFRCFSITHARFDPSAQELAAKLEQELQLETEEHEQTTQSDENIQNFLNNGDWTLSDKEGEQAVKLTRKYEDEIIEVQFTVADFPPPYGEEDEDDDALYDEDDLEGQSGGANTKGAVDQGRTAGGNMKVGTDGNAAPGNREELRDVEDENSSAQAPFPASVTVTVHRESKPGVLRFDLIAEDGEFSIQSITPLPSAEAAEASVSGMDKHWAGPPFPQLDEDLQGFFENYLSERGIDSALAVIVPDYIDVKEQREYMAWLKKVKEFVD